MTRYKDAYEIWHVGASNPRGVARTLVKAMDESPDPRNDSAIQMILDQLCFLCGMPQPSMALVDDAWWTNVMNDVGEKANGAT